MRKHDDPWHIRSRAGLVTNRRRRPPTTYNAWGVLGAFVLSMLATLALWLQGLAWLR